jgi:hypothetical protein
MHVDANKLESSLQKFAAISFNRLFLHVNCSCTYVSGHLELHVLRKRRCHFDALFLFHIRLGSKFPPSLRVASPYIRDSISKHRPSGKGTLAAKVFCRAADVFGTKYIYLNRN